jgi:CheY-like chemotaxis protein
MEAIGTLAGGIAHDFNNILTLIMGFSELALNEVEPDCKLKDNLQEIFTASERGRDMVKQILTFSRKTDVKTVPVNVKSIAKEALKLIGATIPKTIEIETRFESDALVMGDPTQIHQVLINLCTNAVFAMQGAGGILNIQLTDIFIENDSPILLEGLVPGKYLKIIVSDNGVGISPKIINSIFEPYFTTKDTGQGTGMGLAIVLGIIESYGGKITVSSEIGKGTAFSIYLPVLKKTANEKISKIEKLPCGNEKILFVDDEASIVKMAVRVLEQLGYQVIACNNSLRALEYIQSKPDEFDLLITDIAMPNMNGDSLCAEIVKIRPDIPIILCSGYLDQIDESALESGYIKATLPKPIAMKNLAKTVRSVLDEYKFD